MSKELTLILGELDKIVADFVALDERLYEATGRRAIDIDALRDTKHEMGNNARRAVFSDNIKWRVYNAVVRKGHKIKDVAARNGISPSTVRRYMDQITEAQS